MARGGGVWSGIPGARIIGELVMEAASSTVVPPAVVFEGNSEGGGSSEISMAVAHGGGRV
jgi:hypothetical protein